MRPVLLLLAIAVVLPTVFLLWFMTQAVKNERLAVRSKLVDIYTKHCQNSISDNFIRLNQSLDAAEGIVVFDAGGKVIFPVLVEQDFTYYNDFETAFHFEYKSKSYKKAIEQYRKIRSSSNDKGVCIAADIAQARCLNKLGQRHKAIGKLRGVISEYDDSNILLRTKKVYAYLFLLELSKKADNKELEKLMAETYDYLTNAVTEDGEIMLQSIWTDKHKFLQNAIPSELQSFALMRFIEYAKDTDYKTTEAKQVFEQKAKKARRLIDLIDKSIDISGYYPSLTSLKEKSEDLPINAMFSLNTQSQLYGEYNRTRNRMSYLLVFSREFWQTVLEPSIEKIQELPLICSICDDKGRFVAGKKMPEQIEPFTETIVSKQLPGWKIRLYVDDSVFKEAADKQAAAYTWTCVLVILLVFASGAIAAQTIGRQIKLNRLKNDFIATITHELKTPLSSMRVLVDTLLEGRSENKQQETEYLQLISKENARLSRLIDNFLTFSRMERNKQAFEIVKTNPAEIAKAAAEAVQTKFNGEDCNFTVTIDDDLPTIMADKDAMVTVLVNLLDNAYKYSYDNKRIKLKVYAEGEMVCFSVKDNGQGMTRRQTKKIFDRFYQADSSLSRRAEGTGLGLSIVKFIVDAHKGQIEIDSKPDKGSEFVVKVPI